jgi:hypothetical protein
MLLRLVVVFDNDAALFTCVLCHKCLLCVGGGACGGVMADAAAG